MAGSSAIGLGSITWVFTSWFSLISFFSSFTSGAGVTLAL